MVEVKSASELDNADVLAKKSAAEQYCRFASDYTTKNEGKPWHYLLLPHNKISKTNSFDYFVAVGK
jgi:type III restriction enzyme